MRYFTSVITALLLGLAIFAGAASAQTADEIMKQSHLAYYYAGDDGVAEVEMRLIRGDKERSREFIMLRLDIDEGGAQKY